MNRRTILILVMASVLPLLTLCSAGSIAGGNSSDTGNVVAVRSKDRVISVAVKRDVMVGVYADSYVPFLGAGYASASQADSGDTVLFVGQDDGFYNVLVLDSVHDRGVFIPRVPSFADSSYSVLDSMDGTGGIDGRAVSVSAEQVMDWTYVYLPGSPFWDYTGDQGTFTISGIPAGSYPLRFYGVTSMVACLPDSSCPPRDIADESSTVVVEAGGVTAWNR